MAHVLGPITLSLSGLRTFNIGIAPTWLHLTVCEKITGDTVSHFSFGKAETGSQYCMSTFADTAGADSFNSSAHIVQHYERVGGSITKVLSASFDSFTATGFKLNVDIPNSNYKVLVEAGN